jgi:chromosome segregation ATPase
MDNLFSNLLDQFEEKADITPEWASRNALSKSAYEAVIKKAQEIEERLKKTPRDLMDKLLVAEKQIVVAELAKEIGCSRAALVKSRRPELIELIEKTNVKLSAHFEINAQRKSRDRKPRKDELEARCDQLKKEVEELRQLKIGSLIEDFFSSNISEEQKRLVSKLEVAQLDLKEYKEKSFNQNETIRSLMKQSDISRTHLQAAKIELDVLKAQLDSEKMQNDALARRVENLLHQLNAKS